MIDTKTKIKNEISFISLLLKHRGAVDNWINDGPDIKYFDETHWPILNAIIISNNQNVLLTRRQLSSILKDGPYPKLDIMAQEALFNRINLNIANVNENDFYHLKAQIIEHHITKNIINHIDNYTNNLRDKGGLFAAKDLVSALTRMELNEDSGRRKTIYEDIREYYPKYIEFLKDKAARGDEDIVSCGIREIDSAMVVGFAPGTLTLFCGDVGSFKCEVGTDVVQLGDGSIISIKELYDLVVNKKEKVKILSLDKDNKLYAQNLQSVQYNGVRPVFRVKTHSNFNISTTDNHRYFTLNGYKKLSDIKEGEYLAIARKGVFGSEPAVNGLPIWLGCMLSDGGSSSPSYTFTNFDDNTVKAMRRSCKKLGGKLKNTKRPGHFRINSLRKFGKYSEIDSKTSLNKNIPLFVYKWTEQNVSNLLKAMFSCDGSFSVYKGGRKKQKKYEVCYHTSSFSLACGVRDLLLKFGIVPLIYSYPSSYVKNNEKIECAQSYRVYVRGIDQVTRFIESIGFIGKKQSQAMNHLRFIKNIKGNPNLDVIPASIWDMLKKKFKEHNKTRTGCRRFYRRNVHDYWKNDLGHCGNINKPMSRDTLKKIAIYLDNDKDLLKIANSDIYWDKIVSIESVGEQDVYDISMPNNHNFVGNNIITHNSSMMMNVALNIWKTQKNGKVLIVPLEMPREKWFQKMVSRETRIPFEKIEHPQQLQKEDWEKIEKEGENIKAHDQFYIMESAERIPVSFLRREIEAHIDIFKPDVVVVDYIANLIPEAGSNNARNDLQIGEMLKDLRQMGKPGMGIHENGFAVISGAQIGREGLKRFRKTGAIKGSFYSEDLRGSQEYAADADNIFGQMKDPNNNGRLHCYVIKTRYGTGIFPNGSTKTSLEVQGAIGLIEGDNKDWINAASQENILEKVDDPLNSLDNSDLDLPFDGYND